LDEGVSAESDQQDFFPIAFYCHEILLISFIFQDASVEAL
jgi:hypothetical protein